jgi:hypothetical protein
MEVEIGKKNGLPGHPTGRPENVPGNRSGGGMMQPARKKTSACAVVGAFENPL